MGRPSKTPTPRDRKIAELYATGNYLTVNETAAALGVSASYVRRTFDRQYALPLVPKALVTVYLSDRLARVESLRKELTAIKRAIPKKRKAVTNG